jgi:hypothetical protein
LNSTICKWYPLVVSVVCYRWPVNSLRARRLCGERSLEFRVGALLSSVVSCSKRLSCQLVDFGELSRVMARLPVADF